MNFIYRYEFVTKKTVINFKKFIKLYFFPTKKQVKLALMTAFYLSYLHETIHVS